MVSDASCVGLGVFGEPNQPVNLWTMHTFTGLGVFSGRFRAESKTVLSKAQSARVEASWGFYCPGFIQPNKQTNKLAEAVFIEWLLPHNLSLFTP